MAWLTKSRFLSGLQCPKRLWFEVNQPLQVQPSPSVAMIQGRTFDRVVQQLESGIVISRNQGVSAAIAETQRVLQSGGVKTIYQPAFRYRDRAVISDILRLSDRRVELVEVKASTSVKDEHIPDAAYQTLVLREAKMPVDAVFIGHIDNTFVLRRPGEYAGLNIEEDVTDQVQAIQSEVAGQAAEFLAVMAASEVPDVPMGPQCNSPYECPFIERCTKERGPGAEYPVEILPRGAKRAAELRAEGYEDLCQVPPEKLRSERHRRVQTVTLSGVPFLDPAA